MSLSNIIGFIFLGVISTIVATGMNNFCLGRMQASTMSAFGGLSTVTTILIGVFIGGEELYYYHYIGVALILIRAIGVSTIAILRDRRKIRAQENSDTPERSNESAGEIAPLKSAENEGEGVTKTDSTAPVYHDNEALSH